MPLVMRSFSAYRRSLRPGRRRCRWLLRERPGGALPPASRMPRCPRQTPGPFGKNQDLQCRTGLEGLQDRQPDGIPVEGDRLLVPRAPPHDPQRACGQVRSSSTAWRTRSSRSKTASSPRPKATERPRHTRKPRAHGQPRRRGHPLQLARQGSRRAALILHMQPQARS
jgi:hypothetical protein